jgi:hypothetical protein
VHGDEARPRNVSGEESVAVVETDAAAVPEARTPAHIKNPQLRVLQVCRKPCSIDQRRIVGKVHRSVSGPAAFGPRPQVVGYGCTWGRTRHQRIMTLRVREWRLSLRSCLARRSNCG